MKVEFDRERQIQPIDRIEKQRNATTNRPEYKTKRVMIRGGGRADDIDEFEATIEAAGCCSMCGGSIADGRECTRSVNKRSMLNEKNRNPNKQARNPTRAPHVNHADQKRENFLPVERDRRE